MISADSARDHDCPEDHEAVVSGSIGWMAFLRADVIPYTAFEYD